MIEEIDDDLSTTFLLIRHGETKENRLGLMQGRINTKLSDLGKEQASLLAENIQERFPEIHQIFSSSLSRAFYTASLTAKQLGLDVIVHPSFLEICWGDAEGVAIDELKPLFKEEYYLEDRCQRWEHPYFENAESYNTVFQRAQQGLRDLAQKFPGKTIAIFTHSRVIQILIDQEFDKENALKLHNCAIAKFIYDPRKEGNPLKYEDLIHLVEAEK